MQHYRYLHTYIVSMLLERQKSKHYQQDILERGQKLHSNSTMLPAKYSWMKSTFHVSCFMLVKVSAKYCGV